MSEIVERFDLSEVNKSAAFFDVAKLDHFNATYIQAFSADEFVDRALPFVTGDADVPWDSDAFDAEVLRAVAPDVQQRVKTLSETRDWIDWLFVDDVAFDDKAWAKGLRKAKRGDEVLAGVRSAFAECDWNAETLEAAVRGVGDGLEVRSQVPVRVAVTGKQGGIPLWDGLAMLGRDRALARLDRAMSLLAAEETEPTDASQENANG